MELMAISEAENRTIAMVTQENGVGAIVDQIRAIDEARQRVVAADNSG